MNQILSFVHTITCVLITREFKSCIAGATVATNLVGTDLITPRDMFCTLINVYKIRSVLV